MGDYRLREASNRGTEACQLSEHGPEHLPHDLGPASFGRRSLATKSCVESAGTSLLTRPPLGPNPKRADLGPDQGVGSTA